MSTFNPFSKKDKADEPKKADTLDPIKETDEGKKKDKKDDDKNPDNTTKTNDKGSEN
jgi:hypothetical protein